MARPRKRGLETVQSGAEKRIKTEEVPVAGELRESEPILISDQQFVQLCHGDQLDKVSACLTLGVSVGAVSEGLRVGCEAGRSAVVSLLGRREGVEVNCPDQRGWTAAHHASYRGHTECLRILQQMEAVDWRSRNSDGLTPLHFLISRTDSRPSGSEIEDVAGHEEIVEQESVPEESDRKTEDPENTADLKTVDPENKTDLKTEDPENKTDLKTEDPESKADMKTEDPENNTDMKTEDPENKTDNSAEICQQELSAEVLSNPTILGEIFRHLVPSDIKTVALVNRRWREEVERPTLWTWATVTLRTRNFKERFYSKRFQVISRVDCERLHGGQLSKLFEVNDLNLTEITIGPVCNRRTRKTAPRTLSQARVQTKAMFHSIAQSQDMKLKKLDVIDYISLRKLSPERLLHLPQAVVRLEEICLPNLRSEQAESVFTAIGQSDDLRLKRLSVGVMEFSRVSPGVLARGLIRLENFHYGIRFGSGSGSEVMTKEQGLAVIAAIAESEDLKLRSLALQRGFYPRGYGCTDGIAPRVLSQAVVKLEEISLEGISTEQAESIFTAIAESEDITLRDLYMSGDFWTVSPSVFAQAVSRLEEIDLGIDKVSNEQLEALCSSVVETRDLKLKKLTGNFDLTSVPAEVLCQVKRKVTVTEVHWPPRPRRN